MDFFRNINLFDIGRNIIQGLINGVKNMASSLVNSVKGVVDGAIEGAKNLLGIHSPSRVFMEFGEYSGEGFINGIESMKNAVAKAGQDMADASISLVPNVQNSGINQINSIMENSDATRQIFVLQQYMDSNEIAEYTYQLVGGKLALAGKRRR